MATTSSPRLTSAVGANVTGHEVVAIDAQQGEVVAGVGRHQLGLGRLGLAGQPDADVRRPGDDVGVGEDLAVGGHDDAGARRPARRRGRR